MDRVFTSDEPQAILNSSNPDMVLWSLWAGKETGYKAVRKHYPSVSSAPQRYEVQLSCTGDHVPESGTVHTPCGPVSIRFFITGDYVHCIGATTDEEVGSIVWDVQKIPRTRSLPDYESAFVRRMTKRIISLSMDRDPETIDIIRSEGKRGLGPPLACIKGGPPSIDISMSHDGRFAACAFSAYHAQSDTP